jgi:hypothetical protein
MAYKRTLRIVIVAAIAAAAEAQPRAVEVWGNIGAARAAGDEGSVGNGAIYGAGIGVPLVKGLTFELDVAGMRAERFTSVARILVSPALVWRWGSERVYGFAGGGPGLQIDRSDEVRIDFPGQPQQTVLTRRFTEQALTLHGRGGAVVRLLPRVILRAEAFAAWRFVLPTVGVKIGAGYRF